MSIQSNTLKRLELFISYPSNVGPCVENAKEVIIRNNPRWERTNGLTVRTRTFQDVPPIYDPQGVQDAINKEFFGRFDIYCGLLWHRFGRPTREWKSGVEEEYNVALAQYKKHKKPRYIMFGFCEQPVNPFTIEPDQLAAVKRFREKIESMQLVFTWSSRISFSDKFGNHIDSIIDRYCRDPNNLVPGGLRYS